MASAIENSPLHLPPLEEVARIIEEGLAKNFKVAKVEVIECPDLTQAPFGLVGRGLGGSPRLADVGGPPYLIPVVKKEKVYDIATVAKNIDLQDAFIVGAGAGPFPYVGTNSEMMANVLTGEKLCNGTRISKLSDCQAGHVVEQLPTAETGCALLANLFASKGEPGTVLHVKAQLRTGDQNFVSCMREALRDHYGKKPVGVGGTFLMAKGSAKCHVMPDFSTTPLNSDDEVANWLRFFEMPAPMVFLSTFVSHDPGLDLRVEHSHGFGSAHGGHYHYDTTPNSVEYEGYFNLAEYIYRIDRPQTTHNIGRD
ncbi:ester hydrolase C11orf54 homolog [Oratosquilla oratoria]|uniref:ester hydrolase C11orf54 homolog n=1 Tax=Oratosquilla oratoria TaxID=337810 RepID=UPI003F7695AB